MVVVLLGRGRMPTGVVCTVVCSASASASGVPVHAQLSDTWIPTHGCTCTAVVRSIHLLHVHVVLGVTGT